MKGILDRKSEYRDYAKLHWIASKEGDYKSANKYYTKLTKIYKILQSNNLIAKEFLQEMLIDDNNAVQSWAAAHCLGMGILIDIAIKTLEDISRKTAQEAPRLEAQMTLEVWREKGTLTF